MNGFRVISEQIELKPDAHFCIKKIFTETEKVPILWQWLLHQIPHWWSLLQWLWKEPGYIGVPRERQLLWHSLCCPYVASRSTQLAFHWDDLAPYAVASKIMLLVLVYRQVHK